MSQKEAKRSTGAKTGKGAGDEMPPFQIHPYPILDEGFLQMAGLQPMDLIDLWADEGISFFQYRSKSEPSKSRLEEISRNAKRRKLRWILNDYDQLFSSGVADGIHIGWEDWQKLKEDRRQSLVSRLTSVSALGDESQGLLSGFSTHNLEQWQAALAMHRSGELPLSYIAIGPCFKTASKKKGLHPQLTADVIAALEKQKNKESKEKDTDLPASVFIGGIDSDNLSQLVGMLSPAKKRGETTDFFVASIRALSDPLEIRRFRSIEGWLPV